MKKIYFLLIFGFLSVLTFSEVPPGKVTFSQVVQDGTTNTLTKVLKNKVDLTNGESADIYSYSRADVDSMRLNRYTKAQFAYIVANSLNLGANTTAVTQSIGNSSTKPATTAYVMNGFIRSIYTNNAKINNTGNTTENTILTFSIAANSIGINGEFQIWFSTSGASTVNQKTLKIFFGAQQVAYVTATANNYGEWCARVTNRGSLTSQILGSTTTINGSSFTAGSSAQTTSSIDTGASITVTVKAQCVTSGTDNIALERIRVIAIP